MAEKQGVQAPPPYTPAVNQAYQPDQPPQGQPGQPPQGQPGYPAQAQPVYPPQAQPVYLQQGPQGYPVQGQPGYGYPAPIIMQQPALFVNTTTNVNVNVNSGIETTLVVFPSDYCGLAWFSCLCCFWPLGICAIINSHSARDAINRGDLDSALRFSDMARKYAHITIIVGIIMYILLTIVPNIV